MAVDIDVTVGEPNERIPSISAVRDREKKMKVDRHESDHGQGNTIRKIKRPRSKDGHQGTAIKGTRSEIMTMYYDLPWQHNLAYGVSIVMALVFGLLT